MKKAISYGTALVIAALSVGFMGSRAAEAG